MQKIIAGVLLNVLFVSSCFASDVLSEQDMLARKPEKCPAPAFLKISDSPVTVLDKDVERTDPFMIDKIALGVAKIDTYGTNESWQLIVLGKNELFRHYAFGIILEGDNRAKLFSFVTDTLSGLQLAKNSTYYSTPRLEKPALYSENFRWVCHYLTKDPANTLVDAYYPSYY